ncbi:mast cell protease 1A-like [Polypterus senegalus]|uniref:mast cell protease 1A-like n=1 Tax=Polypterus senegalus TaxID=55291 RepID=UPI0019666EB4|nr:mast cell protease 1A-like [Polypterus senegalus]
MTGPNYSLVFAVCLALSGTGAIGYKIVDGNETAAHSRPYMVFLRVQKVNKTSRCGGFLIHQNIVVTAAHCDGLRIKAYVGIHSPSKDARPNQGILVQDKFYPNPNYTLPSRENDILLLRLSQDVTLSANVQLIQYASRATVLAPGTHCSVAGWGRTSKDPASKSDVLREVQVDILNRTKCAGKILTNKMICARGTGVKGTCRGDSGGPLVCKVGNVDTAVGVVSFSKPGNCDDPNRCNVYTKVSEYQTWIDDVLNGIPP